MSLLWVKAVYDMSDEVHADHALAPLFRDAGIKEAPCTNSACKQYDKAADDRLWAGDDHPTHKEMIDLKHTPIYGFECHADPNTIAHYIRHPKSHAHGPVVIRDGGAHYIVDGHHSIAGAMYQGDDKTMANVIDLDRLKG
jgi:hypothetical protein